MTSISVIIPVYNRKKELYISLKSLSNQTCVLREVIIVDDGSQEALDKTDLCTNYANLPIRLIRQKNSGAPAARNRGFAESSGQYVIFWDADVVAEPDMLAKMLQALESNKTAAYAYCNFYMGYKKMKAQEYSLPSLQTCNFICTMSLLRREAFPGFDESLRRFQDWDLWLTIAERGGSGVWVPEFLFRIIQHGGSMSSWLPSFAYKSPWKYLPIIRGQVRRYHEAEQVVRQKHFLI